MKIMDIPFSYRFFVAHPLETITYLLVILALLSIWIKRSLWLWVPLLGLSYVLALMCSLATYTTLVPIVILIICHTLLHYESKGMFRLFVVVVAAVVSLGLNWRLIRGFASLVIATKFVRDPDSLPFDVILNYGTPFIGIFTLAINQNILSSKQDWKKFAFKAIPLALGASVLIILGLWATNFISFRPRILGIFFFWTIANLFFRIIPEEAFYRGFLQRELNEHLQLWARPVWAILFPSILFAISHMIYVPNLSFFIITFLASILYGLIYWIVPYIEGTIVTRFIVNLVHFLLFSYPLLKG